ncbi:hypothetical protein L198_05193 [Cryptococcus wingfieldii CBS 7118]|uniref:Uncharacterized protein n=1 Tax=Cryptococcus wingfieldii CBS 7118 TaxID=1295528 RepID=A0A1E3J2J3_9TREE|nr:hypothetical protein L198_05193 [Cryptococcus wingfieldii CBS 7118]ODN94336.1 hypothetical protein L198_05193 [Cryptococcus wingfieldii CBS 7118]
MNGPTNFSDLVKNIRSVNDPPVMAPYASVFTPEPVPNKDLNPLAVSHPNRKLQAPKTGEKITRSSTPVRRAGALFAPVQYNPPNPHINFRIGKCPELGNVKGLFTDGRQLMAFHSSDFHSLMAE